MTAASATPWGPLDPQYVIGHDPCFGDGCLFRGSELVSSTHLGDGFWADDGLGTGGYGTCIDSRPGASRGFAATDSAFAIVKGRTIRRERYLRSFRAAYTCTEAACGEAYTLKIDDERELRKLLRRYLLAERDKIDADLTKLTVGSSR